MTKIIALAACALLAGCATAQVEAINPRLAFLEQPYDPKVTATNLETALAAVREDKKKYDAKIESKGHEQTSFDSSIIGLSFGQVAAALYKSTAPALGGIGIVTSAAVAYRGYYDPESQGAAYIKASHALACVNATAQPLTAARPQALIDAITDLHKAIVQAQMAAAQVGSSDMDMAASDAANKALDAAKAAEASLLAEEQAFNSAPTVIGTADEAVAYFVRVKTHRSNIDPSATLTAIQNGITTSAKSASDVAAARSQLTVAGKSQGEAQMMTGVTAIHTEAPVAEADKPKTVAAALATPVTPVPQVPAIMAAPQSVQYSGALIARTYDALAAMPQPQFTLLNTQITACTAGM